MARDFRFEYAYNVSRINVNTNIILTLETDELANSLDELTDIYKQHQFGNRELYSRLKFYIFNLRGSIALACGHHSAWLSTHYTFCKRIIYSSLILHYFIEIEKNQVRLRGENLSRN